ncbi:ester cyclase [Streptomyces sp. NPDC001595]|uniref:ester cyclase n=1 Tax=Streptomyces sp. NPDC001532 TaxID=3154520 RepID=UPI003327E1C3
MISQKDFESASALTSTSTRRPRGRLIGAVAGLAVAAALTAVTVPASAQGQAPQPASSAAADHRHHLSPAQVASAFYASYNGDLAAGFDRYISKDLVLHGFNGPEDREAWLAGDLNIKAGLTGFKLTVLDQIVAGDKVVTRWSFTGVHTGTVFGIPASGREVTLSGISIDRVKQGQSVEHWSEGNFGRFLDELRGATPPVTVTPSSR